MRRQPVRCRSCQRRVRQVGPPASGSSPRIRATRACSWRAASVQGSARNRPRRPRRRAQRPSAAGSAGSVRSLMTRRAEAPAAAASTAPVAGSKPTSTCSVIRSRRQRVGVERGGQADARGRLQLQRRDRQQWGIRQRVGARQARAAAARQAERAGLAAALGDAVGKRGGEQRSGIALRRRIGTQPQPPAVLCGGAADACRRAAVGLRIAVGDAPRGGGRYRPARPGRAADRAPPAVPRDRRRARPRSGASAASIIAASRGCAPSAAMRLSRLGDAAVRVERAKLASAAPPRRPSAPAGGGSRNGRSAGGVPQAAQSSTSADSSASRISGRSYGGKAAMQRRGPQPDRDPGRLPSRPAGALVGGGAGDPQRGQPGQAGGRIEPRCPAPAAIDHDPHAGHGQRGLGDRGRQHDPPPLRRPQRRGPARPAADRRAAAAPARRSPRAPPGCGGSPPCRAGRPGCRPSCSASAARTARAMASGRSRGPGMSRAAWLIVDREHPAGALDHLGVHQPGEPARRRRWPTWPAAAAPGAARAAGRGTAPAPGRIPASARAPRPGSPRRRRPAPDRTAGGGPAGPR